MSPFRISRVFLSQWTEWKIKRSRVTGNYIPNKVNKHTYLSFYSAQCMYNRTLLIHSWFILQTHIYPYNNFIFIQWESCLTSFLLVINNIHKTPNITKHINYLSFSWNKVTRKVVVVGHDISVVSKTFYPDPISFIHCQYHSSWTTFKSCMSWGDFKSNMTVFYDSDSDAIRFRGHYWATKKVKSSSWCHKVYGSFVVAVTGGYKNAVIFLCFIVAQISIVA